MATFAKRLITAGNMSAGLAAHAGEVGQRSAGAIEQTPPSVESSSWVVLFVDG